jgi:hypothetical protein
MNSALVSKMEITKTGPGRYHLEVSDPHRYVDEDVTSEELRGMIEGRTVGATWQEILDGLEKQLIGYKTTISWS